MVEGFLKIEIADVLSDTEEYSSGNGVRHSTEQDNVNRSDNQITTYTGDSSCSTLQLKSDITLPTDNLDALLHEVSADEEPHISVLVKMLENGEAIIVPDKVKSTANLSVVWKLFGFVTTKDGKVFKLRILCTLCRKSFIHQKDGNTSTMLRHLRKYHADDVGLPPIPEERPRRKIEAKIMESIQRLNTVISDQISTNCPFISNSDCLSNANNPYSANNTSAVVSCNTSLSDDRQEEIDLAIAKFLIKELQPYCVINNPAFQEMIHICMNIHKDNFPHHTYKVPDKKSLNQEIIPWLYVNVKQRIFDNLYKAQNNDLKTIGPTGAITCDIWIDENQKHHISLAFRFLDDTFQLHWWSLGSREFEGSDIGSKIIDITSEYGLRPNEQIFVTDSNPYIVKACKDHRWSRITCFGHDLNSLFKNVLQIENFKDIKEIFDTCHEIVSCIKRNGLVKKLEKLQQQKNNYDFCELQKGISDCLNSQIEMLESILKNFDYIIEILIASRELRLVGKLSREKIKQILELLNPLKETTKTFLSEAGATICLVWPTVHCIKTHLMSDMTDVFETLSEERNSVNQGFQPQLLVKMQEAMLANIISVGKDSHLLNITKVHKMATILDPRFRSLRFCGFFEKEHIIKELISECKVVIDHRMQDQKAENLSLVSIYENGLAIKKRKLLDITQLYDTAENEELSENDIKDLHANLAENEVKYYLNLKLNSADFNDPAFSLKFWKEYGAHLPELAILARKYLSPPATAVLPEWHFTKFGHVLNEKRSSLPAEEIDNILFLYQNL